MTLLTQIWKTPAEVGDLIKIAPATLATWRTKGIGPAYLKVGGKVVYPVSELERWLTSRLTRTEESHAPTKPRRNLVLAPPNQRTRLQGLNRSRRHKTKQDRRQEII